MTDAGQSGTSLLQSSGFDFDFDFDFKDGTPAAPPMWSIRLERGEQACGLSQPADS